MCATPLSQVMAWTYSQPLRASRGCTVAQPISVFQNHNVVAGPAFRLHASTCGRYHSTSPSGPVVSPWKPRMPYAPSLMMAAGAGHPSYASSASPRWSRYAGSSTSALPPEFDTMARGSWHFKQARRRDCDMPVKQSAQAGHTAVLQMTANSDDQLVISVQAHGVRPVRCRLAPHD